jgi:hypothetical protein
MDLVTNPSSHSMTNFSTHPVFNEVAADRPVSASAASEDAPPQAGVTIGHDVWIGMNCLIPKALTIGHGAIVGAGSVVTKDVEPYSIVAGNPARVIRYRFDPETIARFLALGWWEYDLESLRKELDFSNVPATLTTLEGLAADKQLKPLTPMRVDIEADYYGVTRVFVVDQQ